MNVAVVNHFVDLAETNFRFAMSKAEKIPDIFAREQIIRKIVVAGVKNQSAGAIFEVLDYLQQHTEFVSDHLMAKIEPHAQKAGFSVSIYEKELGFTLKCEQDTRKRDFKNRVRADFAAAMEETELVSDEKARRELMRHMVVASVKKQSELPPFMEALAYLRKQPILATTEVLAGIEHYALKAGICQVSEEVIRLVHDLGISFEAFKEARTLAYQNDPYLIFIAEAVQDLLNGLFTKSKIDFNARVAKVAEHFLVLPASDDKTAFEPAKASLVAKYQALFGKKATQENRRCLLSIYSQFLSLGMKEDAARVLGSFVKLTASDFKRIVKQVKERQASL